jgi:hypothetical protein
MVTPEEFLWKVRNFRERMVKIQLEGNARVDCSSPTKRQNSNAAQEVFLELDCLFNVLPKDLEEGEQGRRTTRSESSET